MAALGARTDTVQCTTKPFQDGQGTEGGAARKKRTNTYSQRQDKRRLNCARKLLAEKAKQTSLEQDCVGTLLFTARAGLKYKEHVDRFNGEAIFGYGL